MNTTIATYEQSFANLWASLRSNPAAKLGFEENPVLTLTQAGIPGITAWSHTLDSQPKFSGAQSLQPALAVAGEKIDVEVNWWGIDFIMNEKLTQDVIAGTTAGGALGTLIGAALGAAGVVTGGIATLIGAALASAFSLKVAEMKIVNNGNGVHWPVTWLQWAPVLAAVPGGPATILAALMVFVHPVRN